MRGKIIVFTGVDATGKETQSKLLLQHLQEKGHNVRLQAFPNYDSPAGALVEKYLNATLVDNPKSLNPMQISNLYLVDFVLTMNSHQEFLNNGGILILDRYTESNLIHQAGNFPTQTEQIRFANTLKNFQYNSLKLPKPDLVICLNMPLEQSIKLMQERKILKNGGKKDVHEQNPLHMQTAHKMCQQFAQLENWTVVNCVDSEGNLRSPARIHNHVKNIVDKFLDFGIELEQ